ncbi:MAG: 2-hydroxyacid dehydrogenase [Sphaerochaeta sp.]|jgi:D-lactate dehydrogenase|nr:2-hydroxyacid dehydrogenase [Sphaerochaeta sp.]
MTRMLFYDTKSYDKLYFDQLKKAFDVDITYVSVELNEQTVTMANGYEVVCAFVNATVNKPVIGKLVAGGTKLLAMRCAGYNNVDIQETCGKLHVVRVPAYSPYAIAEHAMALLLTLVRKTNHAYVRTREFNFSLEGLVGFDLHGKTIGVVGTGKIGGVFATIAGGFGMRVLAYDAYPRKDLNVTYVTLDQLLKESDIISLHCPLTPETRHLINAQRIGQMKDGAIIINTSRGALVDSQALLDALRSKKLGGAALDVYEEEKDLFYQDNSTKIMEDATLALLISMPNVLVTSHQAFLTNDALENIARTTLQNVKDWKDGKDLVNEVCVDCKEQGMPLKHPSK